MCRRLSKRDPRAATSKWPKVGWANSLTKAFSIPWKTRSLRGSILRFRRRVRRTPHPPQKTCSLRRPLAPRNPWRTLTKVLTSKCNNRRFLGRLLPRKRRRKRRRKIKRGRSVRLLMSPKVTAPYQNWRTSRRTILLSATPSQSTNLRTKLRLKMGQKSIKWWTSP